MKLLPEDTAFADYVKERDGYQCVKCKKKYKPGDKALNASHFWSRRHWALRFHVLNVDTLCYGCHAAVENDKQGWYREFKINQLGKRLYNTLERKINQSTVKKHESIGLAREFLQHEGFLRQTNRGTFKATRPHRGTK